MHLQCRRRLLLLLLRLLVRPLLRLHTCLSVRKCGVPRLLLHHTRRLLPRMPGPSRQLSPLPLLFLDHLRLMICDRGPPRLLTQVLHLRIRRTTRRRAKERGRSARHSHPRRTAARLALASTHLLHAIVTSIRRNVGACMKTLTSLASVHQGEAAMAAVELVLAKRQMLLTSARRTSTRLILTAFSEHQTMAGCIRRLLLRNEAQKAFTRSLIIV